AAIISVAAITAIAMITAIIAITMVSAVPARLPVPIALPVAPVLFVPPVPITAEDPPQPIPERVALLRRVFGPSLRSRLLVRRAMVVFVAGRHRLLRHLLLHPALMAVAELRGDLADAEDLGERLGAEFGGQHAGGRIDHRGGEAGRLLEDGVAAARRHLGGETHPDRERGSGAGEAGRGVVVIPHPDHRRPLLGETAEPT